MISRSVDEIHAHNEDAYDQLISLIENTQGRLAPILVACDDSRLRKQIVQRYEAEARQAKIRPYRIALGQEPSLRAGLATIKEQEPYLQKGGAAVFTITEAEFLLRITVNAQDSQSEVDKFLGYLQWTREGLQEFPYPIVLWMPHRLLLDLKQRARDFWSWRKAELRFLDESPDAAQVATMLTVKPFDRPAFTKTDDEHDTLPPIAELQAEIAQLSIQEPQAPALATFYDRLGQAYAQRINQGIASNLDQDRQQTIAAFEQAITRAQDQQNPAVEIDSLTRLGDFLKSQSLYQKAIAHYERALNVSRKIGNCDGQAKSLNGLGNAYQSLGQYQRAIDLHQKSLEIAREIGDRSGEANSLKSLGNAHDSLRATPTGERLPSAIP
ncbi:MAG: tetratricopeptide repeat protein, partial [Alkalinema sp. RU_4_3]|nr:tetratricopeptide repeat protein [Alkalinema sp. RU_4_3]